MFRNFTILIFVLILSIFNANAQKKESKDETTIRANVAQMVTGWNAKNGEGFAKPFAEDADYVVINGMYLNGHTAIAKAHQGIFDSIYKNTSLELSVEKIRFVKPDVAIVHVFGSRIPTNADAPPKTDARLTIVMTKIKAKWEIIAFQNTEIQQK